VTDAQHTYRPANLTVLEMADGRSEAEWRPATEWANPVGNVHGGYVAVLVDDVAGMALLSLIGSGAPTVSLQVEYLNAMPMGRTYTARGEIVRAGKATAIVDVHVYDPDDLLTARGTCFFQLPSSWRERSEAARTR
jgi:acyl-CoA thioesterase